MSANELSFVKKYREIERVLEARLTDEKLLNRIRNNFRIAMAARSIGSHASLAKQSKMHKSLISAFFAGTRGAISHIVTLSEALQIDPYEVVTEDWQEGAEKLINKGESK